MTGFERLKIFEVDLLALVGPAFDPENPWSEGQPRVVDEHHEFLKLVDMLPSCIETVRLFDHYMFERNTSYLSSILDRFREERASKLPLLQEITIFWTVGAVDEYCNEAERTREQQRLDNERDRTLVRLLPISQAAGIKVG